MGGSAGVATSSRPMVTTAVARCARVGAIAGLVVDLVVVAAHFRCVTEPAGRYQEAVTPSGVVTPSATAVTPGTRPFARAPAVARGLRGRVVTASLRLGLTSWSVRDCGVCGARVASAVGRSSICRPSSGRGPSRAVSGVGKGPRASRANGSSGPGATLVTVLVRVSSTRSCGLIDGRSVSGVAGRWAGGCGVAGYSG